MNQNDFGLLAGQTILHITQPAVLVSNIIFCIVKYSLWYYLAPLCILLFVFFLYQIVIFIPIQKITEIFAGTIFAPIN